MVLTAVDRKSCLVFFMPVLKLQCWIFFLAWRHASYAWFMVRRFNSDGVLHALFPSILGAFFFGLHGCFELCSETSLTATHGSAVKTGSLQPMVGLCSETRFTATHGRAL